MDTNQSFTHKETDRAQFSLHDARITSVVQNGTTLTLGFKDGFWVLPTHPNNPYGKILRTTSSVLTFDMEDGLGTDVDMEICVIKKGLFGRSILKRCKTVDLAEYINAKGYYLEVIDFLTEYHNYLIYGILYNTKKNRCMECAIRLYAPSSVYYWNDLRSDAEW